MTGPGHVSGVEGLLRVKMSESAAGESVKANGVGSVHVSSAAHARVVVSRHVPPQVCESVWSMTRQVVLVPATAVMANVAAAVSSTR